jgi:hypothetical protein
LCVLCVATNSFMLTLNSHFYTIYTIYTAENPQH